MENEDYRLEDDYLYTNAKIRVIGVGGGGSNAVNGMIHDKEDQVDYWSSIPIPKLWLLLLVRTSSS
jgi:cell division GTPase FtsZ